MSGQDRTPAIVDRMADFFSRHNARLEKALAESGSFSGEIPEKDLSAFADARALFVKETQIFEREFAVLKREWDLHLSISESDRERIRRSADEAKALVEGLGERLARDESQVAAAMESIKASIGTLRRGKGHAEKYKLGDTGGSRGVDRKA